MSRLGGFLARLRDLTRARDLDEDFRQQIASHLDEATEEFVREGLSPDDARRAALREFGDVGRAQESWREARSFLSIEHLRRDLRHAARGLRRTPGFAAALVGVLALGIGAVTAVFALLNAVVLRPLPFPGADRLVVLRTSAPGLGLEDAGISSGLYFHYVDHSRTLDSAAVYGGQSLLNLRRPGETSERIRVTYASATVFRVLRATPAIGRLFTDEDGRPGFMNMRWQIPVLLSHRFWVDHFGSDPSIVGRVLTINDSPREIVGVMREGFGFPDASTQVWVLIEPTRKSAAMVSGLTWNAVARLKSDQTVADAQAELAALVGALAGTDPAVATARLAPVVVRLKSIVIGDIARVLWLLFGGMALLCLVACANAGGLFLIRAEQRGREIAVRRALGAHGPHLARLFLAEALVLTVTAAALGLVLARGLIALALRLAPTELPRATEIRLDATSAVFAMAMAIAMAVFYGMLSLRRQGRSLVAAIRSARQDVTPSRRWRLGAHAFIVPQVAVAMILLAGSALMVQTSRNLARRDLGFAPAGVLTLELGLPSRKAAQHVRIYRDVVDRLRRVPTVLDASAVSSAPLTGNEFLFPVEAGTTPIAFKFFVPGYVRAMGMSVVEGDRLDGDAPPVVPMPVLVSAALARRLFPGAGALGQSIQRMNRDGSLPSVGGASVPPFTIAGVVGDVRESSLRDGPAEIVYIPVIDPPSERQIVPTTMHLVVRASSRLTALVPSLRAAIAEVDPDLSVSQIRPMSDIVAGARARETFVGTLLLSAAGVSLVLGVIGIYGSVSQIVRRRTREIGIRVALGASRREVIRMVTAGSVRAVLLGAGLGLGVSILAAQTLDSLLFGVAAHDPIVLTAVTAALVAVATIAALSGARHATRLTPLDALRTE